MDALALAELHKDSYSTKELEVYEAIKAHPDAVLGSTATEFSEAYGFSQSAVSRFCKRAGFEGYGDFRMAMHQTVYSRGLTEAAQGGTMCFSDDLSELSRLIEETVGDGQLDRLVGLVCGARRISLLGKGASSIPARALTLCLMLRSLPATFVETGWEEESLHCATSDDLYVVFSAKNPSYSGFVSTVSDLRAEGRPHTVLVCQTEKHPLRDDFDCSIVLPRSISSRESYFDSFMPAVLFAELVASKISDEGRRAD